MRWFNPGFITRPPLLVFWNPNDKASNIFLSGSNLDAEFTSGGQGGVRANLVRGTGSWYCELKSTNVNKPATAYGLAAPSANLSLWQFQDNPSGIVVYWGGTVYKDGSFITSIGTLQQNDIVRIAYDGTGHLVWMARNAGDWNNDASADPETGIGGQLVAGFDISGLMPCFVGADNAQSVEGNFGAGAFTYTAPTGFSAWNAS